MHQQPPADVARAVIRCRDCIHRFNGDMCGHNLSKNYDSIGDTIWTHCSVMRGKGPCGNGRYFERIIDPRMQGLEWVCVMIAILGILLFLRSF